MIAVWQDLGDDGRNIGLQCFFPVDASGSREAGIAVDIGQVAGRGSGGQEDRVDGITERTADTRTVGFGPAAFGLVLDLGLVVNGDNNRQDVTDLACALILEEGAAAGLPERIRIVVRLGWAPASASAPAGSRAVVVGS